MTTTILHHLDQRIRDALDGARGNAAALARSAHALIETAHSEATATADGTTGRARLIDSESVRVALVAASLHQNAGRLAAFGEVIAMIDRAREEEHFAAVGRLEAEASRDAGVYLAELETDNPEDYAQAAFDAMIDDGGEQSFAALTVAQARTIYTSAFLRVVRGES